MARRFVLKREETSQKAVELTIDYSGDLNPQQYAAATAGSGAHLVIAGAGTGKTRTLVYRVAYLVETGVSPDSILLLTFTRRASAEMLSRASVLLDGRCSLVRGGTFHSFCLSVLRRHSERIGYPTNFTILDSSDAADVVDVVRTAAGLHKGTKRFPRKKTLYSLFSTAANRSLSIPEVVESRYPQFFDFIEDISNLSDRYAEYKRRHVLMDYDDLMCQTIRLFDEHPDVRNAVSGQCRHVLVDEYQDTNRAQARLVEHFCSVYGNVTAVGDDAQSVYAFRGADSDNIFEFPDRYPDVRVLKLEQNYRSRQPILHLANKIITQATRRYDKVLFSDEKEGDLPALVAAPNDQFESRFVCQLIGQLREESVPLNRTAVLFRSGFNSYQLEIELNRRNIPFVKYGGVKLSEAAHVKDVIAHLKVLENPRDAAAWNRVLLLLEGIGPKTAQEIMEWVVSRDEDPFVLDDRPFSPRYVESLTALFAMLRSLFNATSSLENEVEQVLAYYEPILKSRYFEDYPKRLQDLEHFAGLAVQTSDRAEFLASLALDPIELTALEAEAADPDEPPLVLSTIHSAKGLEFDTVFIIQALEGILPSSYSLKDPDALDEELRLLYVAVTRAERNLFISYPMVQQRRFDGEYFARPSRFLEDIDESLLEPWSLVEEDAAPVEKQLAANNDRAQLPF
ncbi:MAG: ATP-dependent helicase [Bacteroidetes bacterium]|nr:ATP-dependent helicase [Bacteroidota bacterium]